LFWIGIRRFFRNTFMCDVSYFLNRSVDGWKLFYPSSLVHASMGVPPTLALINPMGI
jgi:hypothetical protein